MSLPDIFTKRFMEPLWSAIVPFPASTTVSRSQVQLSGRLASAWELQPISGCSSMFRNLRLWALCRATMLPGSRDDFKGTTLRCSHCQFAGSWFQAVCSLRVTKPSDTLRKRLWAGLCSAI